MKNDSELLFIYLNELKMHRECVEKLNALYDSAAWRTAMSGNTLKRSLSWTALPVNVASVQRRLQHLFIRCSLLSIWHGASCHWARGREHPGYPGSPVHHGDKRDSLTHS